MRGGRDKAAFAPCVCTSPITPERGHSQHSIQRVWALTGLEMQLEGEPPVFSQILPKNLLPGHLNSSLVPVTPQSPAQHYLASLCKRLDQSNLQTRMQWGSLGIKAFLPDSTLFIFSPHFPSAKG